jgi:hypothetical protein
MKWIGKQLTRGLLNGGFSGRKIARKRGKSKGAGFTLGPVVCGFFSIKQSSGRQGNALVLWRNSSETEKDVTVEC